MIRFFELLIATILACVASVAKGEEIPSHPPNAWRMLLPGLEFAEWDMPTPAKVGDSKIRIVRADIKNFALSLHMVSAGDASKPQSSMEWATNRGLVAVTNAGMYQKDGRTAVSLMQRGKHINNARLSRDKSILAMSVDGSPTLLDRECDDWDKKKSLFRSFVQNIRMISCRGKNVWSQQDKIWSQVAVGTDNVGNILFLHARAPYSTHDFARALLELPLGLQRAMYLEGGPPAQLAVNTEGLRKTFIGSYSTGSNENDANAFAIPLPNVIGLKKR